MQMTGRGQPVQRGAQRALAPQGQDGGQRLDADVGAVGEPVDVSGDGRLAGRQVREVVCGARPLVRCGDFSVAGYIDRLPDGSDISVKTLAAVLPLWGQCALRTALNRLATAGHL
ncbi:hypothetical protein ACM614_27430, partial [Streptomyces sp. 12297]